MLRVLPNTFKPVNNLICCKTGLMWGVKRATSLFNSFFSHVAKQVACFFVARFPYLYAESSLRSAKKMYCKKLCERSLKLLK